MLASACFHNRVKGKIWTSLPKAHIERKDGQGALLCVSPACAPLQSARWSNGKRRMEKPHGHVCKELLGKGKALGHPWYPWKATWGPNLCSFCDHRPWNGTGKYALASGVLGCYQYRVQTHWHYCLPHLPAPDPLELIHVPPGTEALRMWCDAQ